MGSFIFLKNKSHFEDSVNERKHPHYLHNSMTILNNFSIRYWKIKFQVMRRCFLVSSKAIMPLHTHSKQLRMMFNFKYEQINFRKININLLVYKTVHQMSTWDPLHIRSHTRSIKYQSWQTMQSWKRVTQRGQPAAKRTAEVYFATKRLGTEYRQIRKR